jgi:aspartate kinase
LTIGIIVRRAGLERAVRAVHDECGLGMRAPEPVTRPIRSPDTVSR